ncbi:hypothetical protein [Nocardioides bruguierae]|uniref:Uncharacterized protein n=1 Tax=Nocardioides bruguierae TaxID=2945102 RepID=A0A9X2D5G4_9ACTN|nr:hypothetical protein [Nocardioides bruguierae]MCM0619812.1 hypothetical protein [Nocardioides bruguierae]
MIGGPVGSPRRSWEWCRVPGCDQRIRWARVNDRPRAFEWEDRPPFTPEAGDALVLVNGQAFTPREAIEHYQVRLEITEAAARELVSGYPFHRLHQHTRDEIAAITSSN